MKALVKIVLLLMISTSAGAADPLPYTANLTCYAGSDCRISFIMVTDTGTPVDLTGTSYAAEIRKSLTDTAPLATFIIERNRLASGIIPLLLPRATTTALANKTGVWFLRQTGQTGEITYLERGVFKCLLP